MKNYLVLALGFLVGGGFGYTLEYYTQKPQCAVNCSCKCECPNCQCKPCECSKEKCDKCCKKEK